MLCDWIIASRETLTRISQACSCVMADDNDLLREATQAMDLWAEEIGKKLFRAALLLHLPPDIWSRTMCTPTFKLSISFMMLCFWTADKVHCQATIPQIVVLTFLKYYHSSRGNFAAHAKRALMRTCTVPS